MLVFFVFFDLNEPSGDGLGGTTQNDILLQMCTYLKNYSW